ncbi:MAG: Zn-ribbon domain-containing OB-fold protein [Thermoproteota archaeon]
MDVEQFTIEQFYKYLTQGRLMGGKCKKCGKIYLPPRPLCTRCFSKEFEWIPLSAEGRVLTYTIIHVAPPQFKKMVPYAVGIIKLKGGPRIPGMIREVDLEDLEVGIGVRLKIDKSEVQPTWPQWPRYYFVPL